MADFEAAKAALQAGDTSLYDHLSSVLLELINKEPGNGLEIFETLSAQIKASAAAAATTSEAATSNAAAAAAWGGRTSAIMAAEGSAESVEKVKDFTDDADLLEWCGVGIGKEEAYRLTVSMRQLVATAEESEDTPGFSKLRFWGKILGTGGDYYIVEAEKDAAPEDTAELEGSPKGPNSWVYWVCSEVGSEWKMLPDVTVAQVAGASKIRRFFTGSLDAAVAGHPPFPGKEKEYLRAQIARIASATSVSPKGFFVLPTDEDGNLENPEAGWGDVDVNEELEPKGTTALSALGGWTHHRPAIGAEGRCHAFVPEDADEDAAPPAPPACLPSLGAGDWAGPTVLELKKVAVRSLVWPGAVAMGFGKTVANAYVGYGIERISKKGGDKATFTPAPPMALQAEYDDSEWGEGADLAEDPAPPAEEEAEEEG